MYVGIDKRDWDDIELFRVEVEEIITVWFNHEKVGHFEFGEAPEGLSVGVFGVEGLPRGVVRPGGQRRWFVEDDGRAFMTLREAVLGLMGISVGPRSGTPASQVVPRSRPAA